MHAWFLLRAFSLTRNNCAYFRPSIDLVVRGHGIETLPSILKRMAGGTRDWKGIRGIAYASDGQLNVGNPCMIKEDLDRLPIPRREGLPVSSYKIMPMLLLAPSHQRILSVYTAWGCKYRCSYCLVPQIYGGGWFAQSPERVLEELRFVKEHHDINFVHFHDDDFCMDVDRVAKICNGMIERNVNLKFGMMTRFDHLNKDIVDLMERAGLIMVTLGIEAGTEEGLRAIHKGLTLKKIRQALEITRNRKMQVNGTYMIGFPWESREQILEAFKVICSLPLDTWSLNTLIPFKGLKIRERMEREGLIESRNIARYSYKQVVVRTNYLQSDEIRVLTRYLLTRYYFRFSYIYWLIRRMVRYPVMFRSSIEIFLWGVTRRSRLLFQFRLNGGLKEN